MNGYLLKQIEANCALTRVLQNYVWSMRALGVIDREQCAEIDNEIPYYSPHDPFFSGERGDYFDYFWELDHAQNGADIDKETNRERKVRKREERKVGSTYGKIRQHKGKQD